MEYHLVSFASKPPAPLAPLAVGQSDLYPYVLKINTQHQSGLVSTYEHVNVRKLLLGPFDLVFALIYLLPLFIIALCYDVVAGEKEQGILGLLAAQPVSLPRLVSLKLGFRMILIVGILIVLLTLISGLIGVRLSEPWVATQLLTWFTVVVAYSLFWFLLSVFIISWSWRSATNALALAGCWLLLVVLVPAGVSAWITAAYPLPSRVEFIKTMRDTQQNAWKDPGQFTEQFFVDHPNLRPQVKDDERAAAWPLMDRAINRQLQAIEAEFAGQLQRQQNLAERLKFVSPALLIHSAMLDLTGTGITRQREFLLQVDVYHTELENYFIPKLVRKEYDFTGYDEFPRFHYQNPVHEGLQASFVTFAALAGQALVLAMVGLPRLRRYPVAQD
jgi:ABC-2 type transport system permease protein